MLAPGIREALVKALFIAAERIRNAHDFVVNPAHGIWPVSPVTGQLFTGNTSGGGGG